ncbi:MAG: substrate-binding domain-containing protein, partial [Lachnospiraceae bacterium]|nr:substrate-binding domain-containing protein [Lachnospiraceae bacterium]
MKMKKGFGYLFTALVLMALAGNGCGKEEENAVKEPGGTPWPTAVFPATDVPEKTEDGQEEKANGQEGEKDVKKTEEGQDEKEDAEAAFKTDSSSLLLVTPVPQDAVKEIAGSIAPKDYPVVDGSTATLPLSQALYSYATGEGLAAAEAAIVHTKTTNSYYRLYNGEADLLIVYEPPQEIIDRMQTENLLVKPIGMDALVFMANEGNPVQSLTKQQLIDIYSGKIKNWKEVGVIYKALLAFQRPKGSGSQTLMQKLVMGDVEMEDGDNVYRYSTMADILEGMAAYSGEANTLGYSVFYYANFMYSLPKLRFMGVDGVMPSMQSIYDGSYPFVNAFYAVIRPDEPEDSGARRLFDWLTGQEGQQMVLDLGYVPVKMPDGVNIAQKEAERAGEPQVTPVKNLASGQHFILFQREPAPTHNFYGDLWIYDENWNCIDSFKAVNCSEYGVTDERYISIYRWKPDELRGEGEHTLYIYDLKEEKFIDLSGIISGEVMVLDGKKG